MLRRMTHPLAHTAEVRAHNRVMRYTRSGSGPLLLLLGGDSADDLWPGLHDRLAADFKVIVPELPKGDGRADVANWLACLLDGIGATNVFVVTGEPHRDTALALGEGDYVSRVVVLERDISVDDAASRIMSQLTG
jgi:hypothetical protein